MKSAIFIHGVGQQDATFADNARRWLRPAFPGANFQSAWWAPYADRPESSFLAATEKAGSRGAPSQKLVVGTLADALMYQSSPELRANIKVILDNCVAKTKSPVTVFAHSLGCLAATDWIRERPGVQVDNLVTFGCNLGIFNLGQKFRPVKVGRWINLWHPRDMLGWPVGIDSIERIDGVRDVKVSFGWLKGWTGLAHTRYWDAQSMWQDVVPKVLAG